MTPRRYWRGEVACYPDAGIHLGCDHADVLPYDPPAVMPRYRRMCKRGLHDLSDPANRTSANSGCAPCRNTYQANLRRHLPLARIRAPKGGDDSYCGPSVLSPDTLAYLRQIAACRQCGVQPAEDPSDGIVKMIHKEDCTAEP